MYYKLIDKESALYKKLYDMRAKELQIEKDNAERIKQRYPKWNDEFLGRKGQQNFNRVTIYLALGFDSEQDIDLKEFSPSKEHKGLYKPNLRTKKGKECKAFFDSLGKSSYFSLMDILADGGVDNVYGRFIFPYIEIGSDGLYCYFDDRMKLPSVFIEITSVEFNKALNINSNK
jgi:hypothetical protein|nr:MAG TPA: hypothetical protein [Caudoviricetes sp.]